MNTSMNQTCCSDWHHDSPTHTWFIVSKTIIMPALKSQFNFFFPLDFDFTTKKWNVCVPSVCVRSWGFCSSATPNWTRRITMATHLWYTPVSVETWTRPLFCYRWTHFTHEPRHVRVMADHFVLKFEQETWGLLLAVFSYRCASKVFLEWRHLVQHFLVFRHFYIKVKKCDSLVSFTHWWCLHTYVTLYFFMCRENSPRISAE